MEDMDKMDRTDGMSKMEEVFKPTYKDPGQGITQESLQFWNTHKKYIGEVVSVRASIDPILSEEVYDPYGLNLTLLEYNAQILGSKGVIFLSGCNSGYGGEGPNGTKKILIELGVQEEEAEKLMYEKYFVKVF